MELEDLTFVGICICLPLCLHFCTSCNFFRSCFFSWWPCWFQASWRNKTEKARKLGDGGKYSQKHVLLQSITYTVIG